MSILPIEICKFEYYVKKCPLYLQNDENFLTHFKIWFDFLMGDNNHEGVVPTSNTLLSLINVFDSNYLNIINELEDTGSDLLDKLGQIFNISRNFKTQYYDSTTSSYKEITFNLSNEEYLTFIKAIIIKNQSDGSYQQMEEYYKDAGLNIYFKTDTSGTVRVYLLTGTSQIYSENIQKLFLTGLLTIESVGIEYLYSIQQYDKMLIWDKEPIGTYTGWDYGEWVL